MSYISQLAEQAGSQATGGIIGAGMGLLLEGHNDRRQIRQQQKLTDMQSLANERLAQFNYGQQMKMWEDTNYSAQMKQLEKAGLNPSLIYGMGGGGGATTNAAQAGGVSGAQAPSGGGEIMGLAMQQQQLGLMAAQRANIEADTKNKQADTANKPIQGKNIEAQTGLAKAETTIREIESKYANTKGEWSNQQLEAQVRQLRAATEGIQASSDITQETKDQQIEKIKTDAANAILTGEAIKKGIEVNNALIHKISQELAQGWENIGINQFRAEIEANFKGLGNIAGNLIQQIFHAIDTVRGQQNDQRPIKIK